MVSTEWQSIGSGSNRSSCRPGVARLKQEAWFTARSGLASVQRIKSNVSSAPYLNTQ
jgi:hypothetical protein